jgi:hypothetical protein
MSEVQSERVHTCGQPWRQGGCLAARTTNVTHDRVGLHVVFDGDGAGALGRIIGDETNSELPRTGDDTQCTVLGGPCVLPRYCRLALYTRADWTHAPVPQNPGFGP